ncbi:MAG: hypothetical protein ABIC04_06460 [Nanoarchaeota archaeon]
MKKNKFLIIGVILACLIGACAANASALDFGGWVKKVLGIRDTEEQPKEIFVPIEEIKIEEDTPTEGETAEEETMEEPAGIVEKGIDAKVIIAQETEKIKLTIDAEDPDKDKLNFEYTTPLNSEGEWQTTYGDEGEYTVTITASDGELAASESVLIIVNKKEEAPTIDEFLPGSLTLQANEDSELEFSIRASDKNQDKLSYTWKTDGKDVSAEEKMVYKMDYDAAGSHTVKVTVSDNKLETTKLWSVDVINVNRKPELTKIPDINVKETDTVEIVPDAVDPDGDELTYTISEPIGDEGIWETGYDSAGSYDVTITVSDGEDTVSQTIKVVVGNVNRAPVIKDIVQK